MYRRRYLEAVAVAGTGVALTGCTDGDGSDPASGADVSNDAGTATATGTATPDGTSADVAEAMTGWWRRDHYGGDPEDPPSVRFAPGEDRVYVHGAIVVGSSSCKEAAVQEVSYDDGELYVYVTDDYVETEDGERPRVCTSDVVSDAYEVAVTFDGGLPARVVAEERHAGDEERRTVRER